MRGGRMASLYHKEWNFHGRGTIKDIGIGTANGLTVPFALATGISGAISAAQVVVRAGVAEVAAGSIATRVRAATSLHAASPNATLVNAGARKENSSKSREWSQTKSPRPSPTLVSRRRSMRRLSRASGGSPEPSGIS